MEGLGGGLDSADHLLYSPDLPSPLHRNGWEPETDMPLPPKTAPVLLACLAALSLSFAYGPNRALAAPPLTSAAVKRQLQSIYAAQDIAIAHKNAAAFYKWCPPNFVAVDAQGHATTLAQDKGNFAVICAHTQSIATKGVVQSVALMPDGSASAVVKVHIKAITLNPRAELVTDETVRDVWVKKPAGWQNLASRTLTTRTIAKPVRLDSFSARPAKR